MTCKQECIPVGCVSSAAVAVCWGGVSASVHAGIGVCLGNPPGCGPGDTPSTGVDLETPQVWPWRPPRPDPSTSPLGMGLAIPPRPDPSTFPLGVGLEISPRPDPSTSPPGCGPRDLQCMLGYHLHPREQNSWHTLLKILPCPNFVAGSNEEFLAHLIRSLDGLSFKMLHFHSFMTFIDLGYFFLFVLQFESWDWSITLNSFIRQISSKINFAQMIVAASTQRKDLSSVNFQRYRKEYNWSVNKPKEKLPLSDKTGSQWFTTIILVNKSVLHRNTFQQVDSLFFGFQQSLSLCRLLRLNRNVMEIDAQVLLILTKLSHHWLVCNFQENIR